MGRCGSVVRRGGLSACMDGSVPSSLFAASILGSGMLLINHGDIASGGQLPNWWVIALTYGLIYLTFTIGLMYARLRCPTCRNRIVVAVEENPNPEQDVSVMDYLANKDRTATPTEETPRRFQPQPRLLLHYREDEGERDREQDKNGNGNGNGGSNRVKSIYALAHEDVILDPPKNDIEMGFGGGHPRVAPGVDPRFSGSSGTSSWQVEESLRQDRAVGDSTQQQEFHESAHSLSNLKNERAHIDEIRPCSSTTRVHWEDLGGPSVVQSPSLEERASRLHERGRGRETGRGRDRERARGRTSSRARHRHRSRSRRDVKSDRNEHHMEGETSERSGRGPERGRSRIRGSSTSARQTVSPGRTVEVTHDVMVYKNSLFMEDMAVIDTYRARDKSPAKEPDVRSSSTVVSSTSFRKWLG
ncbi:hypothetical protein BSKO_00475 [Bryopsis sp. KO-2023]|nr:hypothetical protein BSKO_00475 [Bryopsis sp. KO-2023]